MQPAGKLFIALDFYLNQELIANTLCINRDKPELLCSGKCVLNTMLEKSEESEKQQIPTSQKYKIEYWIVSFPNVQEIEFREHIILQESVSKFNYADINGSAHHLKVVHPPEQA